MFTFFCIILGVVIGLWVNSTKTNSKTEQKNSPKPLRVSPNFVKTNILDIPLADENEIPPIISRREMVVSHLSYPDGASLPGQLTVSDEKLSVFYPEHYKNGKIKLIYKGAFDDGRDFDLRQYVFESIYFRLAQPAMVMQVKPLKIAVHNDEHDAIVLINVPDHIAAYYEIELGQRLLALCSFAREGELAKDITIGPRGRTMWKDVHVMIAEFLSDEMKRIQYLKNQFGEDEWARVKTMANDYYKKYPKRGRTLEPDGI